MTDTSTNPTLTFDNQTYNINDLSEDIQYTLSALQVADSQVSLYRDSLNVLTVGRAALSSQLAAQLADVEPVVASEVEEVKEVTVSPQAATKTKPKSKCHTNKPNIKRLKVNTK